MACFHPLLAVDYGVSPETGKHVIKILPQRADFNLALARERHQGQLMMLPCGHCVACAKDYARTWQARIMCERMYHAKACFVTLTYKENTPPNKEDARSFLKALRNKFGKGLKFFLAGELGSITNRFHLHAILFGVDFAEDRKAVTKIGLNLVYTSEILDKLWNKGFCSIGEVDVASAGYVSQYCDKKKIDHLNSGEFVIMSRGLGKRYFEDHKQELFNSDYIYFNGNKFKLPKYFLKLALGYDYYLSLLAQDYQDRKRLVAQSFRYDKSRSVVNEEEAMLQAERIALADKKHKEGDVRDVL